MISELMIFASATVKTRSTVKEFTGGYIRTRTIASGKGPRKRARRLDSVSTRHPSPQLELEIPEIELQDNDDNDEALT